MKNILKKNQVIITALAIMIIVAGYLQFTKDKANEAQQSASTKDTLEVTDETALDTASSDVLSVDDATSELLTADLENGTMDISDGDNAAYEAADADVKDGQQTADATQTATQDGKDSTGEAVLVNTTIGADFFASAKLQREQVRAKNRETLMSLVDNKNLTEAQKQEALDKVYEMTEIAEKENAAETWLEAKGFDGAVVTINEGKVDVIVGVHNATEQTIAQIEDIVKNKTGVSANKITINPVVVKEAE